VLVATGVVLYAGFVYAFQRGAVRDLLAVVRRD
jgi:hypothetical protein